MPHSPSLSTPNNPKADGITYLGTIIIKAPPTEVFAAILDFASYSTWNTFTPTADFPNITSSRPPQIGDTGLLQAFLTPSGDAKPTHVKISYFNEDEFKIAWQATDFSTWVLRPERVQEVVRLEDEGGKERCEFRNYETMAGPLRLAVKAFVKDTLDQAMERMAGDLKKYVEGKRGKIGKT